MIGLTAASGQRATFRPGSSLGRSLAISSRQAISPLELVEVGTVAALDREQDARTLLTIDHLEAVFDPAKRLVRDEIDVHANSCPRGLNVDLGQ